VSFQRDVASETLIRDATETPSGKIIYGDESFVLTAYQKLEKDGKSLIGSFSDSDDEAENELIEIEKISQSSARDEDEMRSDESNIVWECQIAMRAKPCLISLAYSRTHNSVKIKHYD
jgi:hypothetical protein